MAVVAPVVMTPAPYEVSFGHVIGRVGAGTERVYVTVGGRVLADKPVGGRRFDLKVDLPQRDVAVRVTAVGGDNRATTVIAPGRQFRRVATNTLDGSLLESMAVSGGSLFIRSDTHLYRVGGRQ